MCRASEASKTTVAPAYAAAFTEHASETCYGVGGTSNTIEKPTMESVSAQKRIRGFSMSPSLSLAFQNWQQRCGMALETGSSKMDSSRSYGLGEMLEIESKISETMLLCRKRGGQNALTNHHMVVSALKNSFLL
jgi:hypothetical protein